MQITNYQCPACTGPLHFAGESGKLECDYCGSSFDVAEIEALYAEKEEKAAQAMEQAESAAQAPPEAAGDGSQWDTSDLSEDWGAEGAQMRCGADLRRNHRRHLLSLLRQPFGGAGAVFRGFETGFYPTLSAQ